MSSSSGSHVRPFHAPFHSSRVSCKSGASYMHLLVYLLWWAVVCLPCSTCEGRQQSRTWATLQEILAGDTFTLRLFQHLNLSPPCAELEFPVPDARSSVHLCLTTRHARNWPTLFVACPTGTYVIKSLTDLQ